MRIKGTHALVTGSGRRMGNAVAKALLDAGARVTTHTFSAPAPFGGPSVFPVRADLRKVSEIYAAVNAAVAHFGPIDILINCAAIFHPTPALSVVEDQWNEMFEVNLRGQFFFRPSGGPGNEKGSDA